jgi:hypothetical protein
LGTSITITAINSNMLTSRLGAATISGTSIRIIAGERNIYTSRQGAATISSTIIVIIAVYFGVITVTRLYIARIRCAEIVIIAEDSFIGTLSFVAIISSTRIVIITINRSDDANTSNTGISSARIVVIADNRRIYAGTGIRAATISSAEVEIVTIYSSHRTSLYGIARRGIARKSGTYNRSVNATSCDIARVISTGILIIAINRSVRNYTRIGTA